MDRRSVGTLAVAPALVLMAAFLAAPASAAVPRCFGEKATIVGSMGEIHPGSSRFLSELSG